MSQNAESGGGEQQSRAPPVPSRSLRYGHGMWILAMLVSALSGLGLGWVIWG